MLGLELIVGAAVGLISLARSNTNLHEALEVLDDRSRDILYQRWLAEEKATLHDLAQKYNVSAERIRQLEKSAMNKLKLSIAA